MRQERRQIVLAMALAGLVAAWLFSGPGAARAVLPAVEAEAFSALAGKTSPELWEWLKTMGIAAVVLREDTLADLAARGDVLHFSQVEVEKMRALGLFPGGGGPKPNSIWVKDQATLARFSSALADLGVDVASGPFAGGRTIEIPERLNLARVAAGLDPALVAEVSAGGMIPVGRLSQQTASGTEPISVAGHRMWVRTVSAAASKAEFKRAFYSRRLRLLLISPASNLGLEENAVLIRDALRTLRATGLPMLLPAQPETAPSKAVWMRVMLYFLIGFIGPLLAIRAAMAAAQAMRSYMVVRAPIASPVPEVIFAMVSLWACATASGAMAAALVPVTLRETYARSWWLWTMTVPWLVAMSVLFAPERSKWEAQWNGPLKIRDLAVGAAFILAAVLLLTPRGFVRVPELWDFLDRLAPLTDAFWWLPWRWREMLIGAPCMVFVVVTALMSDGPAGTTGARRFDDPRRWLILGQLAPAATVAFVGAGNLPLSVSAAHGAAVYAIGAALGLGAYAALMHRNRIGSVKSGESSYER